jgi:uracil-DNA glycosylase family 4
MGWHDEKKSLGALGRKPARSAPALPRLPLGTSERALYLCRLLAIGPSRKLWHCRCMQMSRDYAEYLECLGFSAGQPLNPGPAPRSAVAVPQQKIALKQMPAKVFLEDSVDHDAWKKLREQALACENCKLSQARKTVVFGCGNPQAQLMFVGEGPGADEDVQGEPFVGKAGQLLTKMIQAMKLSRDDVYIANVVKCRPPENRNPEPDEIEQCSPYLLKQVELVQPSIIVALGTFAAQTLLRTQERISSLRGRFHERPFWLRKDSSPILIMPTFHPAFLLRNPENKKEVWQDLQEVMKHLGVGS